MTPEEAKEISGLIAGWGADGSHLTLTCAQDVADALAWVSQPRPPRDPCDFYALGTVGSFTGAGVIVIDRYEPGQWKLVRHDSCDVIGGHSIEDAIIVSHKNCTVLGENR